MRKIHNASPWVNPGDTAEELRTCEMCPAILEKGEPAICETCARQVMEDIALEAKREAGKMHAKRGRMRGEN